MATSARLTPSAKEKATLEIRKLQTDILFDQALLQKAFRDWAGTESEQKRISIRNILSNAAATIASDDIINLFLDWINDYSEAALSGHWRHLQQRGHHPRRYLAQARPPAGP
jgi:hypothetical protein